MSKMAIRVIEEELPTISESIRRMDPIERLSLHLIYHHAKKHVAFNQSYALILDVGCGDGLILQEISDMIRENNCEYIGIDISLRKLYFARTRSQKLGISQKTHFILADAENLPFLASIFRIVIIIEVLEHLVDPKAHITELARVILPTGKVIITTPSAYRFKASNVSVLKGFLCPLKQNRLRHRQTRIVIYGKTLHHRDFTKNEIIDLLTKDFALKKIYSFNFGIPYITRRILPYRILERITWCLEAYAHKFPYIWGRNWLILCEKKNA